MSSAEDLTRSRNARWLLLPYGTGLAEMLQEQRFNEIKAPLDLHPVDFRPIRMEAIVSELKVTRRGRQFTALD